MTTAVRTTRRRFAAGLALRRDIGDELLDSLFSLEEVRGFFDDPDTPASIFARAFRRLFDEVARKRRHDDDDSDAVRLLLKGLDDPRMAGEGARVAASVLLRLLAWPHPRLRSGAERFFTSGDVSLETLGEVAEVAKARDTACRMAYAVALARRTRRSVRGGDGLTEDVRTLARLTEEVLLAGGTGPDELDQRALVDAVSELRELVSPTLLAVALRRPWLESFIIKQYAWRVDLLTDAVVDGFLGMRSEHVDAALLANLELTRFRGHLLSLGGERSPRCRSDDSIHRSSVSSWWSWSGPGGRPRN